MSKPITVTIPHELGVAEARRRIDDGVERFTRQMGAVGKVSGAWEGDEYRFALSTMGQDVSGRIGVLEKAVQLELLLPGLLGMIAGKLTGRLRQEGQLLLEKKS